MMSCNYDDYNIVSLLSVWTHQAASEEILQKQVCRHGNRVGINAASSQGTALKESIYVLCTASSKGNIWEDEKDFLH